MEQEERLSRRVEKAIGPWSVWIPVGVGTLVLIGWLTMSAFYRSFGLSPGDLSLGTAEALQVGGVQTALLAAATAVGFFTARLALDYSDRSPSDVDAGFGDASVDQAPTGDGDEPGVVVRVRWAGVLVAVFLVLPWIAVLAGGWPFRSPANGALVIVLSLGFVAGAFVDHWARTDRGAKSPFRLVNLLLMALTFIAGITMVLAPNIHANSLREGALPNVDSLWILPSVAQVRVISDAGDTSCALLLRSVDDTYIVWDFDDDVALRIPAGSVQLRYEECEERA